jgi:acyl-coenzyme A thioesterase PaaI-like protein
MLIDSAMGLAAMAAKPGESLVTSTLNLNYVAPIEAGSLIVSAEILHISR